MHLDNNTSKKWLSDVVQRTNQMKADLIVVTGDLIEEALWPKRGLMGIIGSLSAKYGVVAIGGNHEYYAGWHHFEELARQTGMQILSNGHIIIGDGLVIAGLLDDDGRRMGGGGPNLSQALAGVKPESPIILLYHRPTGFDKARALGVDLQLSGHTHNGQYPPYNFIVGLIFKYPYGLYREGDSHIYTSCGTSLWGPPLRIGSRSEIVHFTLVSASE
jgi:predicted MPP superfamily phosphohydrolase